MLTVHGRWRVRVPGQYAPSRGETKPANWTEAAEWLHRTGRTDYVVQDGNQTDPTDPALLTMHVSFEEQGLAEQFQNAFAPHEA